MRKHKLQQQPKITAMNYVFGRAQRQLTRSSLGWRAPMTCQFQTPNAPLPLGCAMFAGRLSRTVSTAKPDETEPEAKVRRLDQKMLDEQEQEVRVRQSQVKRPWHRQGADAPPADKAKSEGEPFTKGLFSLSLGLWRPSLIRVSRQTPDNTNQVAEACAPAATSGRERS